MEVIQINLNHCRAAQDLLLQSVRVCKADLAVISEPYKVKDDGDWITDTSGKAAIWLCKRNGKSFLDVHKGSVFVRARIGEMWDYSCYLAPSLSTTDFSHALDTIAFDRRGRYPAGTERVTPLLHGRGLPGAKGQGADKKRGTP